jgi:hypothetical protein
MCTNGEHHRVGVGCGTCHVREAKKSGCAHEASLHPGTPGQNADWTNVVDGVASINILPLSLFKKLDHVKGDLKRTNLSLSGFAGDPMEAKGIIYKEITVGSKTVPTAFFVVDVKGCYNVLLERDWIHTNERVPSTLHQCVIQWIGDEVEVVQADEEVCIAVAESQVDILGGKI